VSRSPGSPGGLVFRGYLAIRSVRSIPKGTLHRRAVKSADVQSHLTSADGRGSSLRASSGPAFVPGDEYLKLPRETPSVRKLEDLPAGTWATRTFLQATRKFLADSGLRVEVRRADQGIPPLGPDVSFKYGGSSSAEIAARAKAGDDLLVALS
jgi:hypothetical protein